MARVATRRVAGATPQSSAQAAANPPARKRTACRPSAARRDPCRGARRVHRARLWGARLDDVARRAGVAKGTIYLYFADKETLFQELVRSMVSPVLGTLQAVRAVDIPARMLVERLHRDLRARDLRHAAQGHHPADHGRRAALSGDRRVLLSRGDRARARDHPADAAARRGARRIARRRARAFPATDRRAGAGRDHVERAVRRGSSRSRSTR